MKKKRNEWQEEAGKGDGHKVVGKAGGRGTGVSTTQEWKISG